MSREPHPSLRRLSMLVVAVPCLAIGLSLVYYLPPENRADATPAVVGVVLSIVGIRFIITALTPYRPRSQEEEDAEGEYPYTWEDRARLKQWGDGHKVGPPPDWDDW